MTAKRRRQKRRRKKQPKTTSSRLRLPARGAHTWKSGHYFCDPGPCCSCSVSGCCHSARCLVLEWIHVQSDSSRCFHVNVDLGSEVVSPCLFTWKSGHASSPSTLAARCSVSLRSTGLLGDDCGKMCSHSAFVGSTVDTRTRVCPRGFDCTSHIFCVKVDEPVHLAAVVRCLCCLRSPSLDVLGDDLWNMFSSRSRCGYTFLRRSKELC